MSAFAEHLAPSILRDLTSFVCAESLGTGMSRLVFVYRPNPKWVIKIEEKGFQNVLEQYVWSRVHETEFRKWFAPIIDVSPLGTVVLMERTTPARPNEFLKQMPAFLTDFKRSNYGMLNGRLVCHDYGTNLLTEVGMTKRMRNADWWDA